MYSWASDKAVYIVIMSKFWSGWCVGHCAVVNHMALGSGPCMLLGVCPVVNHIALGSGPYMLLGVCPVVNHTTLSTQLAMLLGVCPVVNHTALGVEASGHPAVGDWLCT